MYCRVKCVRHNLIYFAYIVISTVAFLTLSKTLISWRVQVENNDIKIGSAVNFIAEYSTIAPKNKCVIPHYEDITSLLSYMAYPNYSCRNLQKKGGDFFLKGLNYLTKDFYVDGQKYICMDPKLNFNPDNCTVYSFGINDEWSFDDEMAKFGCQVYSFDPTMGKMDHRRSERVHFYNLGLSDYSGDKMFMKNTGKVARLEDIMKMLGHIGSKLDYLKIDIEGAELEVFDDLFKTSPNILRDNVAQIAMEIHLVRGAVEGNVRLWPKFWTLLHTLECFGFRLTNNDPNQASFYRYTYKNRKFLCCFELLFVNTNLLSS